MDLYYVVEVWQKVVGVSFYVLCIALWVICIITKIKVWFRIHEYSCNSCSSCYSLTLIRLSQHRISMWFSWRDFSQNAHHVNEIQAGPWVFMKYKLVPEYSWNTSWSLNIHETQAALWIFMTYKLLPEIFMSASQCFCAYHVYLICRNKNNMKYKLIPKLPNQAQNMLFH